jgi:hemerythrin-like metal-binding protein
MRSLQWTEDHSVFVPEMDEEHLELFQALEDLRHRVVTSESAERLEFQVGKLSRKMASHFQHEERLMRGSRYAAQTWHEQQHQAARVRLSRLRDAVRGSARESSFRALEELAAWMSDHVTTADRMLGAHLRNHARERAS